MYNLWCAVRISFTLNTKPLGHAERHQHGTILSSAYTPLFMWGTIHPKYLQTPFPNQCTI
eukprot:jgi/Botrbrau1/12088/Bobra.0186s0012.1